VFDVEYFRHVADFVRLAAAPITSLHSITSSARASSIGGTSITSAFTVLRLITLFESGHYPCQDSGRYCKGRSEDVGRRRAGVVLIHDHPDHGRDPDEQRDQGVERSNHRATMTMKSNPPTRHSRRDYAPVPDFAK
jgi:hypothetical protein